MAYPYASDRDELLSRLRKIEGQIRGIQRMVEGDTYCVDILTQISAVTSGMEKVGLKLLRDHLKGCVSDAIRANGKDNEVDEKLDEVVKVMERFLQA
jgi:CsoR family transcriptional regulator, copper-sensing transcriptional repressor